MVDRVLCGRGDGLALGSQRNEIDRPVGKPEEAVEQRLALGSTLREYDRNQKATKAGLLEPGGLIAELMVRSLLRRRRREEAGKPVLKDSSRDPCEDDSSLRSHGQSLMR
jgi:hypothetical protein